MVLLVQYPSNSAVHVDIQLMADMTHKPDKI